MELFLFLLFIATVVRNNESLNSKEHGTSIKETLQPIFEKLQAAYNKNEPNIPLYEALWDSYQEIRDRNDFSQAMTFRSTRYLFHRVNYLLSTLHKNNQHSAANSTTPIEVSSEKVVPILARVRAMVPNILEFRDYPEHVKEIVVDFLRAFVALKQARKMDNRKLTAAETELFTLNDRAFSIVRNELTAEHSRYNLSEAYSPPADEEIDVAHDLGNGLLFDEFLGHLQEIEKDVFGLIEGVEVLVRGNKCMIFSKVGKWYLVTLPCYLWR